ncbi:MAG: sigma-70 family RNA polymerase sigma factor [Gemmatimonadales bacterium]|nr:MAG: sigma-70 family RNA polymerase sigma factor [Gemmatimonadales bacterium]
MLHSGKTSRDEQFRAEALPWFDDVARFALSLARDRDEADDLTQETFLRALRSWHQYTPGTECRRWLFTICRNHFLRGRERDKRVVSYDDPEVEALAAASIHAAAANRGLGDIFERVDLGDAVTHALDALPAPFREAVVSVDLEDLAYDAAAEVLGVPIGTVRSRLFRGRRLLQKSLLAYATDAGLAVGLDTIRVEDKG